MKADRFARLKQVLLRARDMPEEARLAYLDESCADDPELRREAESLLAHRDASDEMMNEGAGIPAEAFGSLVAHATPRPFPVPPPEMRDYRIVRWLGEGGMGTVYLAEDRKLRRPVALKFLRQDSFAGEEAVARFHHEARTAAALDHPNVCTIYQINESSGQTFIAMAYLDGMTLRERMSSGPLSVEEVVSIGLQVARGLAHAHEKGVVHRDIKPSNIMFSGSGPVKIMDFGLARSGDRSTITRTGTRMGTAGYMSPEQMRGERVDLPTDVWALGVVIHEMLTGRLPFKGESDHAVGFNIVHEKPVQISEVRDDAPPALQAVVERCLEKNPGDRPQAADVVRVLETLRPPSGPLEAAGMPRPGRSRKRRTLAVTGLAVLAALIAFGLWQVWPGGKETKSPRQPRLRRLTTLPEDVSHAVLPGSLSPDGRYLALPLRHLRGDYAALGVVSVETERMRHIDLPPGEVYSAGWMPDSETLLTFEYRGNLPWRARGSSDSSRAQIWLRNIVQNTNRKIYEHPTYTTELWPVASPKGDEIAMFKGNRQELWIMDASGENLRKIREVPPGEWISNPAWSPTGTRLAYVRVRGSQSDLSARAGRSLETCSLAGDTTVVLEEDPRLDPGREHRALVWLPDGRLIFSRLNSAEYTTNDFWSVPVDPTTGVRNGNPERFLDLPGSALGQPTVSENGRQLAFYRWETRFWPRMLQLDAKGDSAGLGRWTLQDWFCYPGAWTRDGRKLFFAAEAKSGNSDIYAMETDTGLESPVAQSPAQERDPCLTPDGNWLLFWGGDRLMRMPVDGGPAVEVFRSSTPVLSTEDAEERVLCAARPGSRCILKQVEGDTTVFYEFDPMDGSVHEELARLDFALVPPHGRCDLSPDGKQVAIISRNRLLILNLGDGSLRRIRRHWAGALRTASWSGDGTWLCVSGIGGEATFWIRRVQLDGESRFLWRSEVWGTVFSAPRPAPDGTRIAFTAVWDGADVWMIEDF